MPVLKPLNADWLHTPQIQAVIAALEAHAPDCVRFVGGCVRNTIMGRTASDIDLATRLRPDDTLQALQAAGIRTIATAIEYGTVTAIMAGQPFEITSLRRDIRTDGRHPVVTFTQDWNEDARRRDFRLNALYAKPDGTVFDPTGGGYQDALAGQIVFIGDPDRRLAEDYLRILRFFRFNAWYGKAIDPDGLAACARRKDGLEIISRERIWKELKTLLGAPDPLIAVAAMASSGVLDVILPMHHQTERLRALIASEHHAGVPPDPMRRLMALMPQSTANATANVEQVADILRLSKAETRRLDIWAAPMPAVADTGAQDLRASLYRYGPQAVLDQIMLSGTRDNIRAKLAMIHAWERPECPVTGEDARAIGYRGSAIAAALDRVHEAFIASDFTLDRAALLAVLSGRDIPDTKPGS